MPFLVLGTIVNLLKSLFIKAFFTSVKFSVKVKHYTCKVALLNWVSLFRGLAWRGTALRRCSEGPQWRAWVFCAHAVFLVAPPSSSQAAKVKETLKNLEWIGNLTRFNLTIFFSSKYRSDKSQWINSELFSKLENLSIESKYKSECNDLTCFSWIRDVKNLVRKLQWSGNLHFWLQRTVIWISPHSRPIKHREPK